MIELLQILWMGERLGYMKIFNALKENTAAAEQVKEHVDGLVSRRNELAEVLQTLLVASEEKSKGLGAQMGLDYAQDDARRLLGWPRFT